MNLQDFATLQAAIDYVAPKERMISQDMIVSFLTLNDCVTSLQTSTNEKAKGFYLAITSGVQEFNLMNSHTVGQSQQALLAYLVTAGAVNQAFADTCVGYANGSYQPFINATKHDFDKAKGVITKTPIIVENGYCTITTTADVESHNPQIYRKITFTNGDFEYIRVAGFTGVSVAKLYRVQCPSFPDMYIDDAYGVVS